MNHALTLVVIVFGIAGWPSFAASPSTEPSPSSGSIELSISARTTGLAENDMLPLEVTLKNQSKSAVSVRNSPLINVVVMKPDGSEAEYGPAKKEALQPASNPSDLDKIEADWANLVTRIESPSEPRKSDKPRTDFHGLITAVPVQDGQTKKFVFRVSPNWFRAGRNKIRVDLFLHGKSIAHSDTIDFEVLPARPPRLKDGQAT